MDDIEQIICLGCGQNLHITAGIRPSFYGIAHCWVECGFCGELQILVVEVKRLLPDKTKLYQKMMKK